MSTNILRRLVFTCLLCLSAEALADCTAVSDASQLPPRIERGQCYELQSLTLPPSYEVAGRMLVKAGHKVSVPDNARLYLKRGGALTVRGSMVLGKGAALKLDLTAELGNYGEFHAGADSRIELMRSATFKSAGPLTVYPDALISLEDNSKLYLSSETVLDNAIVSLKGGALENRSALTISKGARVILTKNAVMSNTGRFVVQQGGAVELSGSSQLSNRRNVELTGAMHFSDTAAFVNYGILDVMPAGLLSLDGGASMSNQHAFKILGTMAMAGHSSFENRNGLKIEKSGTLSLKGAARMVNRGSVQQGGVFETRGDAVLVNKKFFYDEHTQVSLPRVDDAHR